jgi:EmrB/QacA subfamily drug resistance transporter
MKMGGLRELVRSLASGGMNGRWLAISVALGNLLVPLNSTMIVVALPQVARDLKVDVAETSWIVTSYLIAMAALQPIAGRVGDRLGRRNVMLVALVYFALASAGAAAANSILVLAVFRINQAIAAAALVPNSLALLRGAIPSGRRGAEFGMVTAASAVGATVGPLVGGILAAIDWRWIFLVNVPLCAAGLALSWRVLPSRAARETTRFDLAGAVGLGFVLLAAAWVLVSLGRGVDLVTVAIGIAILPAAVALLRYESRHPDPALPPSLFRIRAFAAACAAVTFQNLAMYGTLLALPVALAGASIRSGIALAAFSGGSIIFAPLGGRAADRYGPRLPTVAGGLLLGVGLMPLAITAGQLPLELLAATLAFAGIGLALMYPSMRLAAIEVVPDRYAALAAGVFSTSRYFGGMLGSIAIAIALGGSPSTDSLRALFWLFTAAAFAAAIPSLALPGPGIVHGEAIAEEVAG